MSLRKADPENEATAKVAVVKKYANRRLYNTATSSYVTLDELSQMVRRGEDFVVYDAKTGEDITRSVLTQIILEEDSKGRNLLPIGFLRQLISFYDDNLQSFLPRYLELSMENFARHQDQIRHYMEQTFGRFFPLNQFEDIARQNMALFQRAASMFRPFSPEGAEEEAAEEPAAQSAAPADRSASLDKEMRELKERMELLQHQLEALQRGQKPAD
ncbi:polyhydroxyalkanoate synthesis repressor PhaR [Benzoatithermus flavus]|uniref:Polyhydroxyalkanoate synthesis repressor PhaR n=1 Tax=Benzoatithermus flavus TaxID=3108223 RepID=A0ABU8XMN0_9PROT